MAQTRYVMQLVVNREVSAFFLRPQVQTEKEAQKAAARVMDQMRGVTLRALYRVEELDLKAFGTKNIGTRIYLLTAIPHTLRIPAEAFFIAMNDNKARILAMRKKWQDCHLYRCTRIQAE